MLNGTTPFNHAHIHELEGGHRRMTSAVDTRQCVTLCASCHEDVERHRLALVVLDEYAGANGALQIEGVSRRHQS